MSSIASGVVPPRAGPPWSSSESSDCLQAGGAVCGRPGSEMPHFDKYVYDAKDCYGLSAEELGKNVPPDPHSTSLNKREISALADFILATFVGK